MAWGLGNLGGGALNPNKSIIIVTAPTGSKVTCKKDGKIKSAPEKDGTWTFMGLENGLWTVTATLGKQSVDTVVNIDIPNFYRIVLSYRDIPDFVYTGNYEIVDFDDQVIGDPKTYRGNWKIRFLSSGDFTLTNLAGWDAVGDAWLVSGGQSGEQYEGQMSNGGHGGGTLAKLAITLTAQTVYPIVVGAGGVGDLKKGTSSSAFGLTSPEIGVKHGNGPHEFNGSTGKIYGSAGAYTTSANTVDTKPGIGGGGPGKPGEANTGSGGGGQSRAGKSGNGGTGIVILRKHV